MWLISTPIGTRFTNLPNRHLPKNDTWNIGVNPVNLNQSSLYRYLKLLMGKNRSVSYIGDNSTSQMSTVTAKKGSMVYPITTDRPLLGERNGYNKTDGINGTDVITPTQSSTTASLQHSPAGQGIWNPHLLYDPRVEFCYRVNDLLSLTINVKTVMVWNLRF